MTARPFSLPSASITLGAFFCLLLSACGEKKTSATADWQEGSGEKKTEQAGAAPQKPESESPGTAKDGGSRAEVRFLAYNLRNYLTMRRYTDGRSVEGGKPEKEIEALVKVIVAGKPDILGVCEIGSPEDLEDLRKRLGAKGVKLPHVHRVRGDDAVRSLAILSKYPLTVHPQPADVSYRLNGKQFFIGRGILDATVRLAGKDVRFLGIHLKSKRPIREADQEMMRRNEARLVRKHIDRILADSPAARLVVYGDFNDTKRTKSVYSVQGRRNSNGRLEMLEIADSRGELWTHHWKREDIYSRIDFCMVSRALAPDVVAGACRILDPDYWEDGSDHRALLVVIK